ncbi:hypothetical protein F7230_07400 [Corynebacterium sp. 320]|uniref:Uncharacterized protein n=1 Tax=Corynebacterium zhongnanshanii TaxID=2768834 RepID=A0ABQ6VC02_9CORY|nr:MULTISPECIES: hypothetical protein [Corynebacterium]KAB1502821.1 hypothetical protein F7230_07400 [Corynebacterium sp. 320]KAB1550438.1 hypothetical protein F7232_09110 [Corynebacterium sp. 319]KAB1554831.1 hypothetical protein F7233_00715 [Corynebacterium sp. 321]KAB3519162.1 hypothetical protein F8377_09165 [Corynebacterium zhongnanshanii]KAB3526484.1 hypothetical protein F8354_07400 [Corynebacterium sp. 250]
MTSTDDIKNLLFPSPHLIFNPDMVEDFAAQSSQHAEALSAFKAFGRVHDNPAELVGPGQVGSDVLFTMGLAPGDQSQLWALRLGEMWNIPLAEHFPELAPLAPKPTVVFNGGREEDLAIALAHVRRPDSDPESDGGVDGEIMGLVVHKGDPGFKDQLDGATIVSIRMFRGFEKLDTEHVQLLLDGGLLETQDATLQDVFTSKPADIWRSLMRRRPFPENLLSTWASFPFRN